MSEFIKFECLNRLREDNPTYECRHILAGPALDTLLAHNFKHPFKDTRYCQACNTFWGITIRSMGGMVELEILKDRIDFVKVDSVFLGVDVKGRKIKGGSSRDKSIRNKGEQKNTKQ
ncbi:MAG: hypothetical protein PF450_11850 [Bacteroidales bacterium]|jgi:hypothetical protein|nr:hypothetical protein [Bacteroidales bacterium]